MFVILSPSLPHITPNVLLKLSDKRRARKYLLQTLATIVVAKM